MFYVTTDKQKKGVVMAVKRRKTKKKAAYGGGGTRAKSKGRATAMKRVSRPAKRMVKKVVSRRSSPSRPGGGKGGKP